MSEGEDPKSILKHFEDEEIFSIVKMGEKFVFSEEQPYWVKASLSRD